MAASRIPESFHRNGLDFAIFWQHSGRRCVRFSPLWTAAATYTILRRVNHWQVIGNCAPTLPPLEPGIVPVTTCPTVSVNVTDWPPTDAPKSQ